MQEKASAPHAKHQVQNIKAMGSIRFWIGRIILRERRSGTVLPDVPKITGGRRLTLQTKSLSF